MSIETKLREAGLKFETAELPGLLMDGGLKGTFLLEGDARSHVFVVSDQSDDFAGMVDYDVLCPIKVNPSPEDAMEAARAMAGARRGGIVADDAVLYIRMDMPASLSGQEMFYQIMGLCHIADSIEEALFGGDDL